MGMSCVASNASSNDCFLNLLVAGSTSAVAAGTEPRRRVSNLDLCVSVRDDEGEGALGLIVPVV
jgi:hypothetical protein